MVLAKSLLKSKQNLKTLYSFSWFVIFMSIQTTRMKENKNQSKTAQARDGVINMRISKTKKEKLQNIVDTLRTTRTKLLEHHIDNLIDLYQ